MLNAAQRATGSRALRWPWPPGNIHRSFDLLALPLNKSSLPSHHECVLIGQQSILGIPMAHSESAIDFFPSILPDIA